VKVGDLVKPVPGSIGGVSCHETAPIVLQSWVGIVIGFRDDYEGRNPVVYWNPEFQAEVEYPDQIKVI